jgi:hypothetical protein
MKALHAVYVYSKNITHQERQQALILLYYPPSIQRMRKRTLNINKML